MTKTPTLVQEMGKKVFSLLGVKDTFFLAAFKPAFKQVAHENNIYHGDNSETYNVHFRAVMKEVKCLIKKEAMKEQKKEALVLTNPIPPKIKETEPIPVVLKRPVVKEITVPANSRRKWRDRLNQTLF